MKLTLTPCRLATTALALGLSSCTAAPESTPPPVAEEPPVGATELPTSEVTTAEATTPLKAEVKTLEFEIEIAAPVEKVWDTMFSPEGYTQWTAPFMAGSYFEGSWAEGERIHFLAPGGSGMVAEIAVNRPHEFVSIKHLGYVVNGAEDTTSDEVRSWAPAYENYRFASTAGGTVVTVEQDVLAGSDGYMNQIWPKALATLKSLCEANPAGS